ncbi:hypothetical protein K431DRAFT_299041 [Polychaeton citri CBS 116435]|uniref:Uncharacterized protein n=1 Tax=Polychaeton citri CBS 116435 TaxID=1314669 RepID=A0A9P4UJR2_9PEZI|nr:hypothetical protein K431DRAFT_299041 [Polychaeton citri CBS 116435]
MLTTVSLLLIAATVFGFGALLSRFFANKSLSKTSKRYEETLSTVKAQYEITPLLNFDFRRHGARPYRPFINGAHVAMGINKCPRDDWIQIDDGYLERLDERIHIMDADPDNTIGINLHSAAAIVELFKEVVIKHIPRRFPTMFRMEGRRFQNLVTGKSYDTQAGLADSSTALRILCENVEEDFYFMCPDGQGEWRLQGYIACFPGGFMSKARVGQSFREIHAPVPLYSERIANGVDKFVQRMKGGELIQRMNWSLQVDGKDLFRLDGNNFYPEQDQELPSEPSAINPDDCFLRCERQSLLCLKESGAIVFCVRSYMTPLKDIVREGNGVTLADAIDSMPVALGHYKKRPFWQRDVMDYLRQTKRNV